MVVEWSGLAPELFLRLERGVGREVEQRRKDRDARDAVDHRMVDLAHETLVTVLEALDDVLELEAGDVIYSVNAVPVKTVDALRAAIDGLKPHQPAVLHVERDGKLRYVTIDIE